MLHRCACELLIVLVFCSHVAGQGAVERRQAFDRDPQWEGVNNRIVRTQFPGITQDFGFSKTNFAGDAPGEIGGLIWRSSTPAIYAMAIEPAQTLDRPLSASGKLAFTYSQGD